MAGITVNVSVTDTDKFQEILNIIKQFIEDERVPGEVKKEFKEKMLSVTEEEP